MMPSFTWELESSTENTNDFFTPYPEHWRKWEIASCEEWTSGHDWYTAVYYDEYGDQLDIFCENCPMTAHDLYPDCSHLIFGELDNVTIDAGRHNSITDELFKVNVELHVEKYGYYEPEYDVWIELTKREQP